MPYSNRLEEAFALAHSLHREQTRKGSNLPYITHPMAVAALVGEYGGDENQVIAALLHDAVEDQGGAETLALIRERFGEEVADLVDGCTDAYGEPKPPWQERKQAHIDSIRTAPGSIKLIVAADKLHNLRSMTQDLGEVGNDLWGRFSQPKEKTLWYYAEAIRALGTGWEDPILHALSAVHEQWLHAARLAER